MTFELVPDPTSPREGGEASKPEVRFEWQHPDSRCFPMPSKGAASGSARDDCPERDGLPRGVLGIAIESGCECRSKGNRGSLGSVFPTFFRHNLHHKFVVSVLLLLLSSGSVGSRRYGPHESTQPEVRQ